MRQGKRARHAEAPPRVDLRAVNKAERCHGYPSAARHDHHSVLGLCELRSSFDRRCLDYLVLKVIGCRSFRRAWLINRDFLLGRSVRILSDARREDPRGSSADMLATFELLYPRRLRQQLVHL